MTYFNLVFIYMLKEKILISDLCKVLSEYMSKDQVEWVRKAYIIAKKAHQGQYRKSGEAYIFHPISVAMILAKLKLNYYCITAAILHDCIEDTSITYRQIEKDFDTEVADIVEGVSKLTDLEFHSNIDKQAQNFRKLFLAMNSDMRVMIIKLADRLHNMQTLQSVSREKQLRIAKETQEIHAPIARRLGLNSIRIELDNLCFSIIHPYRYKILMQKIKQQCGNRKKIVRQIEKKLKNRLKKEGLINIETSGRRKQPYSIYKKMKIKSLKFHQVLDMYAFRVIVDNVAQCYQALGIIHNLYKPLPGKFKDYIALPKDNGYQSLHSILFAQNQTMIEVQIRSKQMHFVSEYGIAAHWHYKNHPNQVTKIAGNVLGLLLDVEQNSTQFLESTKNNLFPSEVFVFTPVGEIIQLPFKSTVLDFAYSVHTSIGNHIFSAKIDNLDCDISTELKSGQTVEIITNKSVNPHPSWLQIAFTAKAKLAIKSYLKNQSAEKLISLGRHLIKNTVEYHNIVLNEITEEKWADCLTQLKCKTKDELYMKIALNEIFVSVVLANLQKNGDRYLVEKISLNSTSDKAINFAHCCYPIPGDKVVGVLTTKGMTLHRVICSNLIRFKRKNIQYLDIDWKADEKEEFYVKISIKVANRRGTLALIAETIAKIGINIENIEMKEKDNFMKAINLIISVKNSKQLEEVFSQIKSFDFVIGVSRI